MAYYVYELIDPRDGLVFYVGKGKADRYAHHAKQALSGKRGKKCDLIRDIIACGKEYEWRIVERFADEQAAYDAEAVLVEWHGLDNLTNVIPGGGRAYEAYRRAEMAKATPTPFDIVRKLRKTLLRIEVASAIGVSVSYQGTDLVSVAGSVVDELKAAVGVEYYNRFVPPFDIAKAA